MTVFGLKLMSEIHGPRALIAQAAAAPAHGFAFASISDHFHPWLPEQRHSPLAWSVLGGIATATDGLDLATGVTCPTGRYHPAVIAQAAATVGCLTDAQFTLAVGAGERLNEHVTGTFPGVEERHERLEEAITMIHELWSGEWTTVRGRHFQVEEAKIYDLPERSLRLTVAVSGPATLDLAERVGADGIVATQPDASLVDGWVKRGGSAEQTWTEVPFAWAADDDAGLRLAHERFRFGGLGWAVMSELPTPRSFDAACRHVRPEDVAETVPYGPDPGRYVEAVCRFVDAGFERVAIVPVGDDLEGFFAFWDEQVRPALA
jgi:G6PDH family F420-dependent oxidoreductase